MSSRIRDTADALRIELTSSERELIARPFGPLFRLVSVVGGGASDVAERAGMRSATVDLDAAAVDALIVRLAAWRAAQAR